jgi:hypothetical protein
MQHRNRFPTLLAGCVAALIALAAPLDAQNVQTTGHIRGLVQDDAGLPIAGATVTATNAGTSFQRSAETDEDGRYTIRLLPPGTYTLEVRFIGYQPQRAEQIQVTIGTSTPLNLTLSSAAIEIEALIVTGEEAQIDVSEGGVRQLVTQEQIEDLPSLGRDFTDFINLSGLVAPDPGETTGGQFSIGGQRPSQTSIRIDGADANNAFFGENRGGSRLPFTFSLESIREFQIITNGFDVEYGRYNGGIINAVTRSGTNQFEGTVHAHFRGDYLTSSPFIEDDSDPEITTDYAVQQFGGRISGPIARDKAFFMLSVDAQRRREPQLPLTQSRFAPGGAEENPIIFDEITRYFGIIENDYGIANPSTGYQQFNTTADQLALLGRVDWNLSDNHRLTARYNYQNFQNDNEWNGNFDFDYGLSRAELLEVLSHSFVAELQSVLSPTTFNVLRFQFASENRPRQGKDLRPALTVNLSDGQQIRYGGTFASYNNNLEERRFGLTNDFTKVVGDHTVKIGGDVTYTKTLNQFQNFGSQFQGAGEFRFASLDDFEVFRPSSYFRPIQEGGGIPTSEFNTLEWALYAQDSWDLTSRLNVTLGLRYDYQAFLESPTPIADVERAFNWRTGYSPKDTDNISPRIMFAFDPNADGRMVFRAGAGYFYGLVPNVVAGNVLQTERPLQEVICNGSILDGDPDAPPSPANYGSWGIDGLDNPSTCADAGAGGVPTYTLWSEEFEYPETFKANLGFERLLSRSTRFSLDFLYSQSWNLYTVRNLNLRDAQFLLSTEDDRRVFTPEDQFNPTGENSTGSRRNLDYGDVLVNYSDGRARSFIVTSELSHNFSRSLSASVSYTFTRAFDNSNYSCCTAGGGYADPTTGVFGPNEIGDFGDTDRAWGRSDFSREHAIVGQVMWHLPWNMRVSAFWKSQSGRPWSVVGNDDLNGDGLTGNDRIFIYTPANLPLASTGTAADEERAAYEQLLAANPCIGNYQGQLIERNTCTYPWYHQFDVSIAQRLNTFGRQRLELQVDFFNVLNGVSQLFCDKDAEDFDPSSGVCGLGRVTGVFGSNRELLNPRGYDATNDQIEYSVNTNFGQEDLLGSNLILQFQAQFSVRYYF